MKQGDASRYSNPFFSPWCCHPTYNTRQHTLQHTATHSFTDARNEPRHHHATLSSHTLWPHVPYRYVLHARTHLQPPHTLSPLPTLSCYLSFSYLCKVALSDIERTYVIVFSVYIHETCTILSCTADCVWFFGDLRWQRYSTILCDVTVSCYLIIIVCDVTHSYDTLICDVTRSNNTLICDMTRSNNTIICEATCYYNNDTVSLAFEATKFWTFLLWICFQLL